MASSPVVYAEETLGVHAVWEEGKAHLAEHKELQQERLERLRVLKTVRTALADREFEIATVARGEYHQLSATAFKEKLKEIVQADTKHRELRDRENDLKNEVEELDSNISHAKIAVELATARMKELSGLLEFYAVAKAHASVLTHVTSTSQPVSKETTE